MKKILLIGLAAILLSACRYKSGSGNIVTERRPVGIFSGVSVSGDFNVEINNGSPGIVIEADDNLIHDVQTGVVNGMLKIRMHDDIHVRHAHLNVYITAPDLNTINASASATVVVKNMLTSDHVELHASSGSEIESAIDAPRANLQASSGGELKLSGRTKDLEVNCSSGGTIDAKRLLSEHTNVTASSGASAKVHASISLDATASSGGDISYTGAGNVKKSVSSGGSVEME